MLQVRFFGKNHVHKIYTYRCNGMKYHIYTQANILVGTKVTDSRQIIGRRRVRTKRTLSSSNAGLIKMGEETRYYFFQQKNPNYENLIEDYHLLY